MKIHRQKSKNHPSSKIKLKVGKKLKSIIEFSEEDQIESPYLVHREARKGKTPKCCNHNTQLTGKNISSEFSEIRDKLGLFSDLPKKDRPSFHSIRGLSARIHVGDFEDITDVEREKRIRSLSAKMGHKDIETTRRYIDKISRWRKAEHFEVEI